MNESSKWALILGGSSGLGLATARKLGKEGFNLIILHRDRRSDMVSIQKNFKEIEARGVQVYAFNKNAIDRETRSQLVAELQSLMEDDRISVLVHSIAKGAVKPMHDSEGQELSGEDFQLTLEAMAVSLYDWVKALSSSELFAADTRVISYTSEGNQKAWRNYAAVSAAKAALEAITRNVALEFAAVGIKANCIQAGITDTPSLRMIPNSEALKRVAIRRNPNKRLTTPEDVADAAYLLTTSEAKWITGTVIKVDGGESLR
ncbi:SDR family oxidoreductase [Flagellimonas myxillae]|uniref:SDR family oxidoreductase n=1 Tax=Flagellimonas myxillae TaxID=2942214 RepID=UPI00201F06BD|nr:SDR family oxidoreductase [Muricauda myxillae]MCL6265883.1 SDR family oxidoreductase [Muricauda myxillae]